MQDETAANPYQLRVPYGTRPIFVRALRPYLSDTGTLAADATSVGAPLDWVAKCSEVQIYDVLRIAGNVQTAQLYEARMQQALIDKRAMDRTFMPKRPSERYL